MELIRLRMKKISLPTVLKISPDINSDEISNIVELVKSQNIKGLIISNTTDSNRENLSDIKNMKLGLSGKPLESISTNLIKKFFKETKGDIEIIGVGGVGLGQKCI